MESSFNQDSEQTCNYMEELSDSDLTYLDEELPSSQEDVFEAQEECKQKTFYFGFK